MLIVPVFLAHKLKMDALTKLQAALAEHATLHRIFCPEINDLFLLFCRLEEILNLSVYQ